MMWSTRTYVHAALILAGSPHAPSAWHCGSAPSQHGHVLSGTGSGQLTHGTLSSSERLCCSSAWRGAGSDAREEGQAQRVRR